MSRFTRYVKITTLLCAGVAAFLSQPNSAAAFDRNEAQLFAVLPAGSTHPEGLAVDPSNGDVYVATFDGSNTIPVYNDNGKLLRTLMIKGAKTSGVLLGLNFQPGTGALLVIDFNLGKVLSVNKNTGWASDLITLANPTGSGLNALTFDKAGNIYVSDSFNGAIWKSPSAGATGLTQPWVQDPLLTTAGDPPFGANGLGFNKAESTLFVANTGNDTIVQIPITNGTPSPAAIFTNSINGADGLILDDQDNLWVCANQSDEIVVVDPKGKVIAKLGDFGGLVDGGTPKGLLFPASPGFSPDKKTVYVTNLALDLSAAVAAKDIAVDSGWAAQVKHWTVSKIKTQFQPLPNK